MIHDDSNFIIKLEKKIISGWVIELEFSDKDIETTLGRIRILHRKSEKRKIFLSLLKDLRSCPGWCGSVDQTPACEPKHHWFDSQAGHMPGLRARSQ